MKNILIVGDMMLDIYHKGQVTRISPEAPVPILHRTDPDRFVPGGACNVAMNVCASGHNAYIAGIVGNDANADTLLSLLKESDIDTSAVIRCDIDTITKERFISAQNSQLLRVDTEDPSSIRSLTDYDRILDSVSSLIPQIDLIILSDYMKGLLTYEFTQALIKLASKHNIRVLIDVKDPGLSKYAGAWLLKPNRSELAAMTGMPVRTADEIYSASCKLIENTGCKYVLTTCGEDGMILTRDGSFRHIPAYGKEVYDITGAGDVVIAYLAAGLSDGISIDDASDLANRAAGIKVSKMGTATVSIHELDSAPAKTVVFTNGCFDILHIGHIRYLEQAKVLGDKLIVGVNGDESVRRLKGPGRPINTVSDRVEMLKALECVDEVIVFDEDTPYALIDRLKPDILVKGGDYTIDEVVGRDIVESYGGHVEIIPFVKDRSTTSVIERIRTSHDSKTNKAVFLDRDGTINIEKDYLYRISDFEFIDGSIDALRNLSEAGYMLVIISNQSGIARGYYSEDDYLALDEWLKDQLKSQGVTIEASYYCPHLPGAPVKEYDLECDCRKPGIGLFKKAARDLDLDMAHSFAIGDRLRDLEICKYTECQGFLVNTTESDDVIDDAKRGSYPGIRYASDLAEAASIILKQDQ